MNGSHGHWSKHARWAKTRRERAQGYYLAMLNGRVRMSATTPKRVTFTATVFNAFDHDNLQAALKPMRDALKDMRLIDDDRPSSGHEFVYDQIVKRAPGTDYGVRVTVEGK